MRVHPSQGQVWDYFFKIRKSVLKPTTCTTIQILSFRFYVPFILILYISTIFNLNAGFSFLWLHSIRSTVQDHMHRSALAFRIPWKHCPITLGQCFVIWWCNSVSLLIGLHSSICWSLNLKCIYSLLFKYNLSLVLVL